MSEQEKPTEVSSKKPKKERRKRSAWFGAFVTIIVIVAVVGIGGTIAWKQKNFREAVRNWVYEESPGDFSRRVRWTGKQPFSLRSTLIADRDRAMARGDLDTAAALNAQLAQEALLRANATQRAWMTLRSPQTKLFPERERDPVWLYKNAAADCFGFLIQAGIRLNPESMPELNETVAAETKLMPPGELPQGFNAKTGVKIEQDHYARMFGATEYVKDGLLSVVERYGDHPAAASARDRMYQVMDLIIANSTIQSAGGAIPGEGAEENGNCLQAFARLSFSAPKGEQYAEFAARIADAYVNQALPKNNGMPPKEFDFQGDKVRKQTVQLRDHGNETVPGLAEAYALAVARLSDPKWKARADRWAEPIAKMYEMIFQHGVGKDGLLESAIDGKTLASKVEQPNDNWAYLLNGVLLYTQAARKHGVVPAARLDALDVELEKIAQTVAKQYGIAWEWDSMDGYADTLEGGMYMMQHRPSLAPVLAPWVDDQIVNLWERQADNGTVHGDYLDGNFIRTALMYGDLRSGGFTIEPWRTDVRLGFAIDAAGSKAVIYVEHTGSQAYTGMLKPDRPRYRDVMKLPWDWPRLNSWPEHFVPDTRTHVTGAEGMETPADGDVQKGLKLTFPAGGKVMIRLKFDPPPAS